MRKIINTNIRFNLENEADCKAWERLRSMDRRKYKSYTKAVVVALNNYFDRQERLDADAYLETREKVNCPRIYRQYKKAHYSSLIKN